MLSIVIPVLDEANSLAPLFDELSAVITAQKYDAEIILVDDGSSDCSWRTIGELGRKRSARARHSLSPQFRQSGGPERRV